ncbi:right-handed parallel beta-helix repeat-containing protein (plasmid) [Haloferacaceae archaeon DSL9]
MVENMEIRTNRKQRRRTIQSNVISRTVSRRGILGSLAAGALGAAVLGSESVAAQPGSEYYDQYSRVVNLVDEGADNTGQEPIDDLLAQFRTDDTLIVFPPGRYLMNQQFRYTGFENFGLVGENATIVHGSVEKVENNSVTEGEFSGPTRLFRLGVIYSPGANIRFEGFEFDFTDPQTGLRVIEAYASNRLDVAAVDVRGRHDTGAFGPALFCLTDSGGTGLVDGFRAPEGGEFSENTVGASSSRIGPTGMLISPSHQGELWIRDCELGSFPDNGLYVSGADGRIVVDGGTYRNSNVANIRLRGDQSYIRNATIIVDERIQGANQRGIRLDVGEGLWVENTDIHLSEPNGNAIAILNSVGSARIQNTRIHVEDRPMHAVVVNQNAGAVDILDTEIEMDVAGHAVYIRGQDGESDERVLLRRVAVEGDGPGSSGRSAIRCTRANCQFDELDVYQPGDEYRRALAITGSNCTVNGGMLVSSHIPIEEAGTGTTIGGVTAVSLDRHPSLVLRQSSEDATIVNSTFYEGYRDQGATNLTMSGNTFPSS